MKMAAPNPSDPKKPVPSTVDEKAYILGRKTRFPYLYTRARSSRIAT